MNEYKDQLKSLEYRVARIEKRLSIQVSLPPIPQGIPPIIQEKPKIKEEQINNEYLPRFLENWPAMLGVLFVLLGLGWFLKFAFTQEWLTNTLRFYGCLFASVGIFGGGLFFMSKKRSAYLFVALGTIAMVLSLWAGYVYFDILSVIYAFVGMVLIVFGTSFIAFYYKHQVLAILTTLLAPIVPILLMMEISHTVLMMLYISVMSMTAVCFLLVRGWIWPFLITSIATFLYCFGIKHAPHYFACCLSFGNFFLYFVPIAWITNQTDQKWEKILLPSGFVLVAAVLNAVHMINILVFPDLQGYFLFLLAGILLVPCYFLSKKEMSKSRENLAWFWGILLSLCFLLATLVQFSEENYALAFFLESFLAVAFAVFIIKSLKIAEYLAGFFVVAIALSLEMLIQSADFYKLEFWTLVAGMLTLFGSSWMLRKSKQIIISRLLGIVSGAYLLDIVWQSLNNLLPAAELARGISLIIYTILGICAKYLGKSIYTQRAGLLLIIAVTIWLLAFEVWEMETLGRILTFFSVGGVLLTTVLLDRKQKGVNKDKEKEAVKL